MNLTVESGRSRHGDRKETPKHRQQIKGMLDKTWDVKHR